MPASRVLCVCARAGEEVLYAGGLIRDLAEGGVRVVVAVLAGRVSALLEEYRLTSREDVVAEALVASARLIGGARVELFDMPPPPLSPGQRIELQAKLAAIIREERPDVVLSHGPGLVTAAVDRRAAAGLVDAAIVAAATDLFGHHTSQARSPRHEVIERWFFLGRAPGDSPPHRRMTQDEPSERWTSRFVHLDASRFVDLKWRALRGYLVAAPSDPPDAVRRALAHEHFLAAKGTTAAEALAILRVAVVK